MTSTRMWRVRAGYVEHLALRPHGLAHAVRAEATFDYQRPTEHGPVIEHHSGHAINALNWLLTSADPPYDDLPRPYTSGEPDEPDGVG
ncbi:MAG: hypothetical protein ACRD0P_38690 [Stackebrandtia sp.]